MMNKAEDIETYDFRSDTVTLPTAEMMRAIAVAPLGDSGRGDDPTVNELERLGAELTGKDDALFVPSGAMANLAAVIAHDARGGERSEERRVGKECALLCRSRWSPYH